MREGLLRPSGETTIERLVYAARSRAEGRLFAESWPARAGAARSPRRPLRHRRQRQHPRAPRRSTRAPSPAAVLAECQRLAIVRAVGGRQALELGSDVGVGAGASSAWAPERVRRRRGSRLPPAATLPTAHARRPPSGDIGRSMYRAAPAIRSRRLGRNAPAAAPNCSTGESCRHSEEPLKIDAVHVTLVRKRS